MVNCRTRLNEASKEMEIQPSGFICAKAELPLSEIEGSVCSQTHLLSKVKVLRHVLGTKIVFELAKEVISSVVEREREYRYGTRGGCKWLDQRKRGILGIRNIIPYPIWRVNGRWEVIVGICGIWRM